MSNFPASLCGSMLLLGLGCAGLGQATVGTWRDVHGRGYTPQLTTAATTYRQMTDLSVTCNNAVLHCIMPLEVNIQQGLWHRMWLIITPSQLWHEVTTMQTTYVKFHPKHMKYHSNLLHKLVYYILWWQMADELSNFNISTVKL